MIKKKRKLQLELEPKQKRKKLTKEHRAQLSEKRKETIEKLKEQGHKFFQKPSEEEVARRQELQRIIGEQTITNEDIVNICNGNIKEENKTIVANGRDRNIFKNAARFFQD